MKMVKVYKAQSAERKKTKTNKDYLLLTIDDKLVSFFEQEDVAVIHYRMY